MKGYRTIIFNAIMTLIMVMRLWKPDVEMPGELEINAGLDAIDAAITFVWGLGNLFLRTVTNTPIFKK